MRRARLANEGEGPGADGGEGGPKKDDVIDADFQEVDDRDRKKRA
jgi:molecular chaperone DnaK